MMGINFARREHQLKLVYAGPPLSGKTTNLRALRRESPEMTGELGAMDAEGDRMLWLDVRAEPHVTVMGMNVRFQIFTVPGEPFYRQTQRLALVGVDGVAFIADSRRMDENLANLRLVEDQLRQQGLDLGSLPHVFQWNKRDAQDALPLAELEAQLNRHGAPSFAASAKTGQGVVATFEALMDMSVARLSRELEPRSRISGATG